MLALVQSRRVSKGSHKGPGLAAVTHPVEWFASAHKPGRSLVRVERKRLAWVRVKGSTPNHFLENSGVLRVM